GTSRHERAGHQHKCRFAAARDGRIIDRLDIDTVLGKQESARLLALLWVACHQRHNVRLTGHYRQARRIEATRERPRLSLLISPDITSSLTSGVLSSSPVQNPDRRHWATKR